MTNAEAPNLNYETAQQTAREFLESIVYAETLPALTASFGVEMPVDLDTASRVAWLKDFGEKNLDFREGKSRQDTADVPLTKEQEDAIMATARELKMEGYSQPTKKAYDFIMVTGGANQAPWLRLQYLKKQMDEGVTAPYVIMLSNSMLFGKKEQENTANYAPGAKTQYDLMNAAAERELGLSLLHEETIELKNFSAKIMSDEDKDFWKVRYYVAPDGTRILSASAPQRDGRSGANTTDTFRFVSEVIGEEMLDGADILNVTTDVFTVFQHVDALNSVGLPFNANIETIGYGGIKRSPSKYGQEINSAFRRGARLHDSLQQAA